MSLIRVALIWPCEPWMGGVNYYQSLASSVYHLEQKKVELILFTGENVNTYDMQKYCQVIRTPVLTKYSLAWFFWKLSRKVQFEISLYRLLKKQKIDAVSHYHFLWEGCSIPSIPWIPDFQHVHLPNIFSKKELKERERSVNSIVTHEKFVFLSSEDAKKDFIAFQDKNNLPVIYVLKFTTRLEDDEKFIGKESLISKYNLPSHWFYMPNQFWKHKNHAVVIEALAKIKDKNITVVATGKQADYRHPNYYGDLMNKVKELGVNDHFYSLGQVAYEDVRGLMRHAVAVINPSLFEGWSTTVEESKALGKQILLSDIPVHREQIPKRAVYFLPDDNHRLADEMVHVLSAFDDGIELDEMKAAKKEYRDKMRDFGLQYEEAIYSVVEDASS